MSRDQLTDTNIKPSTYQPSGPKICSSLAVNVKLVNKPMHTSASETTVTRPMHRFGFRAASRLNHRTLCWMADRKSPVTCFQVEWTMLAQRLARLVLPSSTKSRPAGVPGGIDGGSMLIDRQWVSFWQQRIFSDKAKRGKRVSAAKRSFRSSLDSIAAGLPV
jgi:hypothetical protein